MKLNLDCIPCFLRQTLQASRFSGLDVKIQEKVLRETMETLLKENWGETPPELAHIVHAVVRKYAGSDPYASVKKESNAKAMELYPKMKNVVESSSDPLKTAVKLAIAGNIIDFGALEKFDLERTLNDVLARELDRDDYPLFRRAIEKGSTILYFADNAGEIVFDRLLLETILSMREMEITFVVKAGPIINDATLEDAKEVGLNRIVSEFRFISNGEVGVERNSPEVRRWVEEHDVVVSKGQGNYEGLSEFKGIFYMLMVKCPVIAASMDAEVGDVVLMYR
jgi:uncharacterized protein with ATP-grasp and redox domains